jgi:hypothetical protein
MENNHKIYYKGVVVLGVALIAIFFIYKGTIIAKTIAQSNNKTLKEQGLNEYIDPSKKPQYNQVYNEITFTGDGINKEELENINTIVNLKDNSGEEPKAIIGEEIIPISQIKTGQKIRGISYNSTIDDSKITEINYYRGKNEGLDNEREKRKQLKEGKEKNTEIQKAITKLDENIAKQEQKIQKNKGNWDKKIKNKKSQVDTIKTKTQTAVTTSNKELMDILYPSQESIDKLNNEILEERKKSEEFLKNNSKPKLSFKEKVKQLIKIPEAFAWGESSNSVNNLVIYNRSNWDYIWDVDYANAVNGQTFKLWGRANDGPKQFRFIDSRAEIRFVGKPGVEKCVDVDMANGRYDSGDRVHLWDCHGGNNQKFIVRSDGTIRPKFNQNYCLDASAGVTFGSRIHLWQCHGGQNQIFNAGEYDFDGQRFYLRIYASSTGFVNNGLQSGHALTAVWRTGRGVTNTFSFWPDKDTYDINDWDRTNNIGTGNNINVDEGKGGADWRIARHNVNGGYKYKDIEVTKKIYDEVKYMRGYTMHSWRNSFVSQGYNPCWNNCASYSVSLWGYYTSNWIDPVWNGCHAPGGIYDKI